MKLELPAYNGLAIVDVTFNPGRKNDTRPDAGVTYGAHLRVDSATGGAKLAVQTDFAGPVLLALLPEWSTSLAFRVLAELGFYGPGQSGWNVARDGVYAFADGVEYVEPTESELEFMAAFGFTPGARFNLALPMLRAQAAQLRSEAVAAAVEVAVDAVESAQESADWPEVGGADVPMEPAHPAGVGGGTVLAMPAKAAPEVELASAETEPPDSATKPKAARRRRAAKPVGKVEVVSQTDVTADEAWLVTPAELTPEQKAEADAGDAADRADDEADNPFAAFAAGLE